MALYSQTALPAQAIRISELLVALLRELGLAHPRALLWRDLIVDYLHGSALAEAMHGTLSSTAPERIDPRLDPLAELITTLLSDEARRGA